MMSGSSCTEEEDNNLVDSPPTSPAPVSSPFLKDDLLSSSSSDVASNSSSATCSPPSSPVRHGQKRSAYAPYRGDPSHIVPRTTLDRWRKKRCLEAQLDLNETGSGSDPEEDVSEDVTNVHEETHHNPDSTEEETSENIPNLDQETYRNPESPAAVCMDQLENDSSSSGSSSDVGVNSDSEGSNSSDISVVASPLRDGYSSESGSELSVESSCNGSVQEDDPFDSSKLYPGSEKTTDEAIYDLMQIYLENNLSKEALKDILSFYNSSLPSTHNMPRSVHYLLKYVQDLSVPLNEIEHFYCRPARHSVQNKQTPCAECGSTDFGVFYELPLVDRLKFLFEHRGLSNSIDRYYEKRTKKNDNNICDIIDGSEYSRIWSGNSSKYNLTLVLNTDGVSPHANSKAKMWPLMFTVVEVDPQIRSSFCIVWGMWFDRKLKPDMNLFLKPFVSSLAKIEESGGITWKNPASGITCKSLVRATLMVADAPARAAVLNMQEHQAKYACNCCEQKANLLPRPQVVPGEKKKPRKRRFLFKENPARLRTHERMIRHGNSANAEAVRGVKGTTVIENIPFIDLSTFVLAEYMHCVLLGVVKQISKLWFKEKGDWYIGDHTDEINLFLLNEIHFPDFVSRLLRTLDHLESYKANELRTFLLYVSLIVLSPYLKEKYLQHWMLLVQAMFILLSDSISDADLISAEAMLRIFVRDLGSLYGNEQYVYNVHQLIHLVLYTRRWGCLWANSAFGFETFNGSLGKMIHGSKNEGKELMNQLSLAQGAQMLKNKVVYDTESASKVIAVLGTPVSYSLNELETASLEKLNVNLTNLQFYQRISIGREKFSSKLYDKSFKRRNSYVGVRMNDKRIFGRIVVFCTFEERVICLIAVYKVDHSRFFFHKDSRTRIKFILPIESTEDIISCDVQYIKQKGIQVGNYLCFRPNTFESNL